MANNSKHFSKERVSTCQIAGAVALCAIRDLRVNLFRFGGFPQITVSEVEAGFNVRISVEGETTAEASFLLNRPEAIVAAKAFQRGQNEYNPAIFDQVQEALACVVG
jgi:hypothetical protein